ncbi:Lrp/AsnC family transcriptional regulator [Pseudonocardia sp. DR1-2]|uniref:Lrp/AsnC family transcriptional regulator n=1 Tax=Pseudonocardia sp. DR1-2 TaxID=2951168 RepID=UPI0020445FDE|nr:Lrp/AsnC family transcriptional regulator [Pseudonocardia sp. DR1-2]MCM3846756.1 Lrp/AsnC family transcriptional regulator [Pseudonocardia sp. DR1-2]
MTSGRLDDLDRLIVAALQVDGRAPWRRVAEVIGEPERTVTRRGTELLVSGAVRISALGGHNAAVVVRAECATGAVRAAVTALAHRRDCVYAYALTGPVEAVAEIRVTNANLPALVLDELPATVGLLRARVEPVLRVLRSVRQWRPDILTPVQIAGLEAPPHGVQQPDGSEPAPLSAVDRSVLRVLADDGRAGITAIARAAGISESTARRRLDWLLVEGHVWPRAVVEPTLLGYPLEAILWVRVLPDRFDDVAAHLLAEPAVRQATAVAGEFDLVVDVAVRDQADLYDLLSAPRWREMVQTVEVSVVLQAMKRSGLRVPAGGPAG